MAQERALFEQRSRRRAIGPGLVAALPQILPLIILAAAVATMGSG